MDNPTELDTIAIEKLKELGIKTKIKRLFKEERFSIVSNRYYLLENHKYLLVKFENKIIMSIVRQINPRKGFSILTNGQASQNAEQIYLW